MATSPIPRVGVGVIVLKPDGMVLIGQRLSKHGAGEYALPGGHLEFGESFEQCAARELVEETGIVVQLPAVRFAYAVNSVFDSVKHYVTIFMVVHVPQETVAHNTEPDKCAGWDWVAWSQIPSQVPVFLPLRLLIESGFVPVQ